jgi:hypothetical protein
VTEYVAGVLLDDDALASQPRWDAARLREVPGRCRGDLLGPWGTNLNRRFGPDAVTRVRRRLAPPLDRVEPDLGSKDWVPAYAQIALTEAIVDEFLGGELRALFPLLVEDTRASVGRVHLTLLRTLGAARAFALAPRSMRKVHERGTVDVTVTGRRARLVFSGHPLFAHPSWRLLQLYAQRIVLDLAGTPGEAVGEEPGAPDGFTVVATW